MTIQTDMDDIEAGRLESKIIEEACASILALCRSLAGKPIKMTIRSP